MKQTRKHVKINVDSALDENQRKLVKQFWWHEQLRMLLLRRSAIALQSNLTLNHVEPKYLHTISPD